MDLYSETRSIKQILGSKSAFFIPKYQREFSWTPKREIGDLFNDVLSHIIIDHDSLLTEEHFLGTMIFQGEATASSNSGRKVYVVDGQQRLTAITIFLRALSDAFDAIDCHVQSSAIFDGYIVGKDDDGQKYTIFTSETPQPFFRSRIQMEGPSIKPVSDEEIRIEEAYKYFEKALKFPNLTTRFVRQNGTSFALEDIYKAIRDQLLKCIVITIWSSEEKYATSVFEVVNARGLELAPLDLVKNRLYSICKKDSDSSVVDSSWKKIAGILSGEGQRIPFDLFFVHYWTARFGKKTKATLYKNFCSKIRNVNDCVRLLESMQHFAPCYVKCMAPSLTDYQNKKQFGSVVTFLKYLTNYLNLIMPRPLLMVLLDKFLSNLCSASLLRKTLSFLARFHFVYTSICSKRTNAIERIYLDAGKDLFDSADTESIEGALQGLTVSLHAKLPSYEQFLDQIQKIKFSNKCRKYKNDFRAKFFLWWLVEQKPHPEIFEPEDFSIEHIFNDTEEDGDNLLLCYLIPLERALNSDAHNLDVFQKVSMYGGSRYSFVKTEIPKALDGKTDLEGAKKALEELFISKVLKFYEQIKPL